MSGGKLIARLVIGISAVALAVSLIGFIAAMGVDSNSEDYRTYGELPLGAETTMHLPAGDVNVSVHSQLTGVANTDHVRMPDLQLTIVPPEGVAAPRLDSYNGASTGGESDFRKQNWIARIPAGGDYVVRFDGDAGTDGTIGPLVNPQIAFGKRSSAEDVTYGFLYLFAASIVGLLTVPIAHFLRRRRDDNGAQVARARVASSTSLKTLQALRDSGAITEREFTFEKRKLRNS